MDTICPQCETPQSIRYEQLISEEIICCIQCRVPLKISLVAEVLDVEKDVSPASQKPAAQEEGQGKSSGSLSRKIDITKYLPLFKDRLVAVCIDGEATREVVMDMLKEVHFKVIDISLDVPGFMSKHVDFPEIALVDEGFKAVPGAEVCSEFKTRSEFEGIIIVLIGSMFERKSKNAAPRLGADASIARFELSKSLLPELGLLLEQRAQVQETPVVGESSEAADVALSDDTAGDPPVVQETFSTSGFESEEAFEAPAERAEVSDAQGAEPDPAIGAVDAGFYEKREEKREAERLASIIVSDIGLYNDKKVNEAIENDNFYTELENEIREGRALFESRVDKSLYFSSIYENALESYLLRRTTEPIVDVPESVTETEVFETPPLSSIEDVEEASTAEYDAWSAWQDGGQVDEAEQTSESSDSVVSEEIPDILTDAEEDVPTMEASLAEPESLVEPRPENIVVEPVLAHPQGDPEISNGGFSEQEERVPEPFVDAASEAERPEEEAVFPPLDDFAPTTVFQVPSPPIENLEEESFQESPASIVQSSASSPEEPAIVLEQPEPTVEEKDAIRLAKIIVSDIVIYNENKVAKGLKNNTFYSTLQEEIEEGRLLFESRVSASILESGFYRIALDNFIEQRTGVASTESPAFLSTEGERHSSPLKPAIEEERVAHVPAPSVSDVVSEKSASQPAEPISAEAKDAIRLAKIIVSDIVIYNEKKVEEGLKMRTFYSVLEEEIEEGRLLFESRVPQSLHQAGLYESAIKDFIKRRMDQAELSRESSLPPEPPVGLDVLSDPIASEDLPSVRPDIASSVADDDFFDESEDSPQDSSAGPSIFEESVSRVEPKAPIGTPRPLIPSPAQVQLDEKEKSALRLAKIIVSDIVIYNEKKVSEGLTKGSFYGILEEEIEEGRQLFESRVSEVLHQSGIYESAIKDFIKQRSESMGLSNPVVSETKAAPDPFVAPETFQPTPPEAAPEQDWAGAPHLSEPDLSSAPVVLEEPVAEPIEEPLVEEETEEEKNAKRLAKIIVSDIVIYNEKKVERGLQEGNFYAVLSEEIFEGKQLYETRVAKKILEEKNYFKEAFEAYIKKRTSTLS